MSHIQQAALTAMPNKAQIVVSLLDASPFGETAKGFVRLGFVVDEASLIDACERIAAFFGGLPLRS